MIDAGRRTIEVIAVLGRARVVKIASKGDGPAKLRFQLVLGVVLFVAAFQWTYRFYINPVWGYMGFAYNSPPLGYFLLACALAILPGFWMPIAVTRPSQLIYWLLYITVYIPSMFVPLYAALVPLPDVAQLMLALFVGFGLMGLSYSRRLLRIRRLYESKMIFWYGIAAITSGFVVWVIVVYAGHFRLVWFSNVYEELRFSGGALVAGTGVGYGMMWLSGAVFPFLMTLALFKRQWWLFLVGAAGELMLYATMGMKGTVLTVVFVPAMYVYLRGKKNPRFGLRLIWTVPFLLIGLTFLNVVAGEQAQGTPLGTASSLVVVRSFAIPALITAQYQKFFSTHPLTYYSHVTGINLLKEYPYERSVGEEVGFETTNSNYADSNANFWATDGLAAFGLPGILLISVLCGAMFWVLDSAADGHDPAFAAVVCCYAAVNIGNTSLFTSFLSGGLGFLLLLFFFMPKEDESYKDAPRIRRSIVRPRPLQM